MIIMIKNKKAAIQEFIRNILWIIIFALLLAGVYFLLKFLTT